MVKTYKEINESSNFSILQVVAASQAKPLSQQAADGSAFIERFPIYLKYQ